MLGIYDYILCFWWIYIFDVILKRLRVYYISKKKYPSRTNCILYRFTASILFLLDSVECIQFDIIFQIRLQYILKILGSVQKRQN